MSFTTRRIRHHAPFRRTQVISNRRITPQMARIVVHAPALEGFTSPGFDDHVRLFFPAPGQALQEPRRGERGLVWPDQPPEHRDYTPRYFDPDRLELTLDFVVHPGGIASDWAAQAKPGDELGLGGPRGSFVIEGRPEWYVLFGDATALPAIGRCLEELPAGTEARAVVEIADAQERQAFETQAALTTTWLQRDRGESLEAALRTFVPPAGEGFVFFAAEAGQVAQARARFEALGLPKERVKLSNYWRSGVQNDHSH